jgi:hypothetical protein
MWGPGGPASGVRVRYVVRCPETDKGKCENVKIRGTRGLQSAVAAANEGRYVVALDCIK